MRKENDRAKTGAVGHQPVRKMTWSELKDRRSKGLRFNCDEKYEPGHKCKVKLYILCNDGGEKGTDSEEEYEDAEEEKEEEEETMEEQLAAISMHALSEDLSPKSMKVEGRVNGKRVMVLVDSGSTHNFINQKLATKLNCPICKIPSFRVYVANGNHLECSSVCKHKIQLQKYDFIVDLYPLQTKGIDRYRFGCKLVGDIRRCRMSLEENDNEISGRWERSSSAGTTVRTSTTSNAAEFNKAGSSRE